jgi:hypothetical protein
MTKADRYIDVDELNGTESDGQFADYIAAQESGDMSEWDYGVVEYECRNKDCKNFGLRIAITTDSVKNYDGLIFYWHAKTKQGDFFSRYFFEYLAFNAYLKGHVAIDASSDRSAIQRLKQSKQFEKLYLSRINMDNDLKAIWKNVVCELKKNPLFNTSKDFDYPEIDKWWDNSGDQLKRRRPKQTGVVHSLKDWSNMVEFWYGVRNNLFHGGKDPSVARDCFLVEHAFKTLNPFMELEISNLGSDLKIY